MEESTCYLGDEIEFDVSSEGPSLGMNNGFITCSYMKCIQKQTYADGSSLFRRNKAGAFTSKDKDENILDILVPFNCDPNGPFTF